jgi:hypothetical protein
MLENEMLRKISGHEMKLRENGEYYITRNVALNSSPSTVNS